MKIIPYKRNREFFPVMSVFDEFLNNFISEDNNGSDTRSMAIDVIETDKDFLIKANLPGIPKENITISIQENRLNIDAKQEESHESTEGTVHRCERYRGNFVRSIHLPETCDANKVSAKLENGILTLTVPKKEAEPKKQITIQ